MLSGAKRRPIWSYHTKESLEHKCSFKDTCVTCNLSMRVWNLSDLVPAKEITHHVTVLISHQRHKIEPLNTTKDKDTWICEMIIVINYHSTVVTEVNKGLL